MHNGQNAIMTEPELWNGHHAHIIYDYLHSFNYAYWEEFPDVQIASLKVLVEDIAARYPILIDPDHDFGQYRFNQKVDPDPAKSVLVARRIPPKPPIFAQPRQKFFLR
jgi:N-acetyl-anhydromuramyl-L-alanine amidase AmpD